MKSLKTAIFAFGLILSAPVIAQQAAPAAAPMATAAPAAPAATAPTPGIGMPVPHGIGIQEQVTPIGREAVWMHDVILMPVIVLMSVFVLALLFWASFRYRRAANPVPSKLTHNTLLEVAWTLGPVLILLGIAVPSISLLAEQYKPPGKNAITIKAIGNQWYWSYEYMDNGGFEVTANMLKDADAKSRGEPRLLATDNRLVIPVGVPIHLLTTSNDVIHAWSVPAFWTQMDAVPGRVNATTFTVEKPGVYYGQCYQICGARHGFMPIAVEAVTPEKYAAWVASKGGVNKAAKPAAAAAATTTPVSPASPAATKS
jgi:cytochrome c oxidase subunit II